MKQNLGKTDRILRLALAFWWLGPWALQYSAAWVNWLLFLIGWIALIESFLGYCWLHDAFGIHSKEQ